MERIQMSEKKMPDDTELFKRLADREQKLWDSEEEKLTQATIEACKYLIRQNKTSGKK